MMKKKEVIKKSKKIREEDLQRKNRYIGLFMLGMMLFSIAGFAFLSSGGGGFGSSGSSSVRDIPLQNFQTDTGEIFWGAIKNQYEFVFMDISGFDENFEMEKLANNLKDKNNVFIYVDDNFDSSDSIFLIRKILSAYDINSAYLNEFECSSNSLILTNNMSLEVHEDCMIFNVEEGTEFYNAESLVYHLLK